MNDDVRLLLANQMFHLYLVFMVYLECDMN